MHITVGVYMNGQSKTNIVEDEDLENHIEYNKIFRFGRGLFVDGECVNQGYLSGEQVRNWSQKIKLKMQNGEYDMSHNTRPYQ